MVMGGGEHGEEHDANVSITSSSSAVSEDQGFETSEKCKKKAALTLSMNSNNNNNIKQEKRWKKNKINKDDFFNKTTQFRTWLEEQKNLVLDELPNAKARELFKKFVKKWNSKRLADKYYVDADPIWAMASPDAYDKNPVPDAPLTPSSRHSTNLSELKQNDGSFSTFGKTMGRRVKSMMDRFDCDGELNWASQSCRLPSTSNKSRPLAEIFQNSVYESISPTTRSMTSLKTCTLGPNSLTGSTRSLRVPAPPVVKEESIYSSNSRRSSMSSESDYMAFGPVLRQQRVNSQMSINSDISYGSVSTLTGSQNIPPAPPLRNGSMLSLEHAGVASRASWAPMSGYHSYMATPLPHNSTGHYMAVGSRLSQHGGFDGSSSVRRSCRAPPPPPPRRFSMQSLDKTSLETPAYARGMLTSTPASRSGADDTYVFMQPPSRVKTRASLSDSALCTVIKPEPADPMARASSDSCFVHPSKPAPPRISSRPRPQSFSTADYDGRGTMRIRARAWSNSLTQRLDTLVPPHSPSRKVNDGEGVEIVSKPPDVGRASIRRKDSYAAALREKAGQLCRKRGPSDRVRKTGPSKLLRRSSSTRVQAQIPCYV